MIKSKSKKKAVICECVLEKLVTHITQFLLELGKGFAFVGEQYCLNLNNKEYFCDLLFYHIPLRAHVVIELKNDNFKPEHLGARCKHIYVYIACTLHLS